MNDLFHPDDESLYVNLSMENELVTEVRKLRRSACAYMILALGKEKRMVRKY